MKKIMLIANDTTFVYKLRKELIKFLINEKYKVIVVAQKKLFNDEIKSLGCEVEDVNIPRQGKNPVNDLKLKKNFEFFIVKHKPDLILTNNIKPNIYIGLLCKKYKIKFIPNITGLGTALEFPGILQKITTYLYKKSMRNAFSILFQNEFNRQFFFEKEIINKQQRNVLLPGSGVNTKEIEIFDYPNNNEINFLFVARINKAKGIDYYLNAAKTISNKYKHAKFHICGLCEDKSYLDLFKGAEEQGYLRYHGEQKNLDPFYKKSNCLIHPSYYPEGMSNVLLEAASHARPIITTDRPGCKETVENNISGYIVPIKNQEQLNNKIEEFINLNFEQKKHMGMMGRKKMEEEFDRDIVINLYKKEIKDALEN